MVLKELREQLREFVLCFNRQKVGYDEFVKYVDDAYKSEPIKKPEEAVVPVSVFSNGYLSALEAIVKFLRENKGLRFVDIARLLGRDQRAVGVTYRFATKKMAFRLKVRVSKYFLPLSVIADKKLSVLETIVYYLKKTYSLSYHDIALLLRRDDRTIWTVYQRALKKGRK